MKFGPIRAKLWGFWRNKDSPNFVWLLVLLGSFASFFLTSSSLVSVFITFILMVIGLVRVQNQELQVEVLKVSDYRAEAFLVKKIYSSLNLNLIRSNSFNRKLCAVNRRAQFSSYFPHSRKFSSADSEMSPSMVSDYCGYHYCLWYGLIKLFHIELIRMYFKGAYNISKCPSGSYFGKL